MGKSRSAGVTVFGLIFIILSILGLLSSLSIKNHNVGFAGVNLNFTLYLLRIIILIASLISGIFILKLRSWARELILLISVINIIYFPISLHYGFKAAFSEESLREHEGTILMQYKPEYRQSVLKQLRLARKAVEKAIPAMLIIIFLISTGWNLLVIYYFDRPKIKEQFQ